MNALQLAQTCEKLGAGEILLNCIDKDCTNSGFDIELINHIRDNVSIPVTASSGAGKVERLSAQLTAATSQPAPGIERLNPEGQGNVLRLSTPIYSVNHG